MREHERDEVDQTEHLEVDQTEDLTLDADGPTIAGPEPSEGYGDATENLDLDGDTLETTAGLNSLSGGDDLTIVLGDDVDDGLAGADVTESLPPSTASGSAETETDVFVLLPEAEDDIPIVPTEEVTMVDDVTEIASADGVTEVDGLDGMTQDYTGDGFGDTGTEPIQPASLDDLTTDLDDEFLTVGGDGDDLDADAYAYEGTDGEYEEEEGAEDEYYDDEALGSSGGVGRRMLLTAAALLLVGVCGLFFFAKFRKTSAEGIGGTTPTVAVTNQTPTPEDLPQEQPTGTVEPPVEDGPEAELVAASRQLFQQKFLLAIQLGFVGESANE